MISAPDAPALPVIAAPQTPPPWSPDPAPSPVPDALLSPLPLAAWLGGCAREVGADATPFRPGRSGACPLAIFARAALGLRGVCVGWGRLGRIHLRYTDSAGDHQEIVLPPWCATYVRLVDQDAARSPRMSPARALALVQTLIVHP